MDYDPINNKLLEEKEKENTDYDHLNNKLPEEEEKENMNYDNLNNELPEGIQIKVIYDKPKNEEKRIDRRYMMAKNREPQNLALFNIPKIDTNSDNFENYQDQETPDEKKRILSKIDNEIDKRNNSMKIDDEKFKQNKEEVIKNVFDIFESICEKLKIIYKNRSKDFDEAFKSIFDNTMDVIFIDLLDIIQSEFFEGNKEKFYIYFRVMFLFEFTFSYKKDNGKSGKIEFFYDKEDEKIGKIKFIYEKLKTYLTKDKVGDFKDSFKEKFEIKTLILKMELVNKHFKKLQNFENIGDGDISYFFDSLFKVGTTSIVYDVFLSQMAMCTRCKRCNSKIIHIHRNDLYIQHS